MTAQSPAERMRRSRQQRAAGLRSYRVYLDDALIEDALVADGYLSAADAEDRGKVAAALPGAIEAWAEAAIARASIEREMLRATPCDFEICHDAPDPDGVPRSWPTR